MMYEAEHDDVLATLSDLEQSYPGFSEWYRTKVVPGIADGSRKVFAEIDQIGDGRLTGVAIAKRGSENKLCTLWVRPDRRSGDLSWHLMDAAVKWIGTDKPLFSIPDDKLVQFRALLNARGYGSSKKVEGIYRPGIVEHVFHGTLSAT